MAVLIDNRQKDHPIAIKLVQKIAQAILNALECPDGELSVALVDDTHIAQLNNSYLGRHGPTNVIAFPMREGDFGDINPDLLGDVVISMDTCAREAREGDLSTETRFHELLVHGILHLFGYDHIHNDEEARVMDAKSKELLTLINRMH